MNTSKNITLYEAYFPNEFDIEFNWCRAATRLYIPVYGKYQEKSDEIVRGLKREYSKPYRTYHNLDHIKSCITDFELCMDELRHPAEFEMAILFHDIVYDIGPKQFDLQMSNEDISAEFIGGILYGFGVHPESVEMVKRYIMVTKHDSVPLGLDEAYMSDIDLAILGSADYDTYKEKIYMEFSALGPDASKKGRINFLKQMLSKRQIFYTKWFYSAFEGRARENMRKELENLEKNS